MCSFNGSFFYFSQSTNIHKNPYSWPVLIKRKISKFGIFQFQLAYYPSWSFLMASLVNGIRDCCFNLIENWRIDVENKEALTDWVSVFLLLPQKGILFEGWLYCKVQCIIIFNCAIPHIVIFVINILWLYIFSGITCIIFVCCSSLVLLQDQYFTLNTKLWPETSLQLFNYFELHFIMMWNK